MPQIFPRSTNTLAWLSLTAFPLGGALTLWLCLLYSRSSYGTGAGVQRVQPVRFSDQHHAGDLGIDCRYCHTRVEYSPYAGFPPTHTCMNGHSQMWVCSEMLAPVRESCWTDQSLKWRHIYNLMTIAPDDYCCG
jgi:hypothetical protein